ILRDGLTLPADVTRWRAQVDELGLGPSGYAYVLDQVGRAVACWPGGHGPSNAGFRPWVVNAILTGVCADEENCTASDAGDGHLVDRVYTPRIVAFARIATSGRH